MCDCVETIENLYKEKPEYKNAQIVMVYVRSNKTGNFNSYPEIRIQYEKGKNNKKCFTSFIPSFCPFCGQEYEKE